MRLLALLLTALLVAPAALAQVPSPPPVAVPKNPTAILPPIDPANPLGTATSVGELATGANLTREDVRARLDLDLSSLDFQPLGVVFGGGDFRAQGRLAAHLEFRAINISKVLAALPEQTPSFNEQQQRANPNRTVVTAYEFRATLSTEVIAAFEAQEQAYLAKFIGETFPDATLLSSRFAWSNVAPQDNPAPQPSVPGSPAAVKSPAPEQREPPVVLDTVLDVQYLKRESLVSILEELLDSNRLSPEEKHVKEIRKKQLADIRGASEGALYERSAFDLLGITQLIVIEVPPGWDLNLTLHLPKGYTYEYASPDVTLDGDHGSANTVAFAANSALPVRDPVAVSLSNRNLVAVALVLSVLLVGALLRLPTMLIANRLGKR